MTPVAVDSPLRKSDVFKIPRHLAANDDEAERRSRRFEANLDDSTLSVNQTVEDNENIKMCLKLYSDNKLNKDNAWSVKIIDTFSKLISRHSNALQNFQVAGSTLEASTKVYGLRVDSVHTDVMRMCSELTRQSARAMDNNREDDDEDASMIENKENDTANAIGIAEAGTEEKGVKKKKKARRVVSTVTKNKDTINASLDTNPFTDPFFAKLNSVVGDMSSANRLMQNIVPTACSELKLRMDYPFWESSESPDFNIDDEVDWEGEELSSINTLPVTKKHVLHNMLSGYVITDVPAEDDDEGPDATPDPEHSVEGGDGMGSQSLNRSALDLQFDINAEVEPIPVGDAVVMDYGEDHDFDDMNADDQMALNACRGLRRQPVVIEDMRPVDLSTLEYSYRPLDAINKFWAGPSHWKFKRPKTKSLSLRFSNIPEEQRKRQPKKKQRFEIESIDDLLSVNEDLFCKLNPNKPLRQITFLKSTLCKKWDNKKLRLPTDLKLDRHRFDLFRFAPGLKVHEPESQAEPDIPVGEYNYDNPADSNYCARVNTDETDTEPDNDGGLPDVDDHHNFDDLQQNTDGNPNATMDFISNEYQGAPDKIAKILIPYAKTAKVVDMKQLKACCWQLMEKRNAENEDPTFIYIYKKLPHVLTKAMSDNISKSLAFYSVLHLANEKSLKLVGQSDLKDFTIVTLERQELLLQTN